MTASKPPPSNGPSLNVYKKIAVIRKPSDSLTYEDAEGTVKTVLAEQLGDAFATATPLQTAKPKHDIPVPEIRPVSEYEYDVSATYQIPLSYVRYHRPTNEELKSTLEYVLDLEDETWLKRNIKFGGAAPATMTTDRGTTVRLPRLSLEMFEQMMDILEKETAFDSIITQNQAEHFFAAQIPAFFQLFPVKAQPKRGLPVAAKHVLNDVYTYWMQKRSKLKRPLIRRFWPVTSTEDTNPHLVFRPREKEKYKLRRKRNPMSMDTFRRMKRLRQDFETIRNVLELITKREQASLLQLKLQIDLHRQELFDYIDTSGQPRESRTLTSTRIQETLQVPQYFEVRGRGRPPKAAGAMGAMQRTAMDWSMSMPLTLTASPGDGATASSSNNMVVAGQNNGQPAPSFYQPLDTRQKYVTSWEHAVPHLPTHVNAEPQPTWFFRHRPRVGRGGRICIDRFPMPEKPPVTILTASKGLANAPLPAPHEPDTTRLLDLLPRPIDTERASARIEEICVASILEDAPAFQNPNDPDAPQNDGEEVVVRTSQWIDTDDHLWGEERHAIGPV